MSTSASSARERGKVPQRARTGSGAAVAGDAAHRAAADEPTTAPRPRTRAAQRSRWIEHVDELRDTRPGQMLVTRSHDVIRHWAAARNATPATATGKRHARRPSLLRFQFPGFAGEPLEPASWERWLGIVAERGLVFHFQERLKDGGRSIYFRLEEAPEQQEP